MKYMYLAKKKQNDMVDAFNYFMKYMYLAKKKQNDMVDAFNSISGYLDDSHNIDIYFSRWFT